MDDAGIMWVVNDNRNNEPGDETMNAERTTISLSEIANEATDYIGQVPALDPELSDARQPMPTAPQIIEKVGNRLDIVDGFHRTAGQIRWCQENGIELSECAITVILCENGNDDTIAAAAEPGPLQVEAIQAIHDAAGIR
jgi:hypothetical protein